MIDFYTDFQLYTERSRHKLRTPRSQDPVPTTITQQRTMPEGDDGVYRKVDGAWIVSPTLLLASCVSPRVPAELKLRLPRTLLFTLPLESCRW